MRPQIGQIWPKSDQHWSTETRFGPNVVEHGPNMTGFGRHRFKFRRTWAKFGKFRRCRPRFGRACGGFGRPRVYGRCSAPCAPPSFRNNSCTTQRTLAPGGAWAMSPGGLFGAIGAEWSATSARRFAWRWLRRVTRVACA